MRTDFRSVLTHGKDLRYPDAQHRRTRVLDDDGFEPCPRVRPRDLHKGWREGDNLRHALARRWLRAQVGRRWDAVHSDMCRALRADPDLVGRMLRWNVEVGCSVSDDGTPHDAEGRRARGLWVDPRDGVLRAASREGFGTGRYRLRHRRRLLTDPGRLPLTEPDDTARRAELRRVDGVWYAYAYDLVATPVYRAVVTLRSGGGDRLHFEEHVAFKRQLASAEIRRLRLRDWAADAEALAACVGEGRDDAGAAVRLEAVRAAAKAFVLASPRLRRALA